VTQVLNQCRHRDLRGLKSAFTRNAAPPSDQPSPPGARGDSSLIRKQLPTPVGPGQMSEGPLERRRITNWKGGESGPTLPPNRCPRRLAPAPAPALRPC